MTPTDAQRRAWGRLGALILHGTGRTNVKPAHEALRLKWEREADPEGVLTPEIRAKRGAMLRRAFMIQMSLKAAEARRIKRALPVTPKVAARPRRAVVFPPSQDEAGFYVIDQSDGSLIAKYNTERAARRCVEELFAVYPEGLWWFVRVRDRPPGEGSSDRQRQ